MLFTYRRQNPVLRRPLRSALAVAGAAAILFFLAGPARSQSPCPGVVSPPTNGCASFYDCFGTPANIATYGFPLNAINNASTYKGDLNSTYSNLYYSIYNANAFAAANQQPGGPPCNVELVIVGNFQNTRYFSVTNNDMHYSLTQHLADFTIDPVGETGKSYTNPFVRE
jgi:hypothetical protein